MGAHLPLFSLTVKHSFFPDGLCLKLDFVPTHKTTAVFKKAGLLVKNTINGLNVFYDESRIEALQLYAADTDDPLQAGFKVFSRDPLFKNYTTPDIHKTDAILYFDNRGVKIDAAGMSRLHDEDHVSEKNFEKLNSPLLKDYLNKKDRLIRPDFFICIRLGPKENGFLDEQLKATFSKYYLNFDARRTFWKYYLLGGMARESAYIADLNNETEFEFSGRVSLPDNRTALTFRSKIAIPLREKYDHRFQLRERDPGGGKVLVRRLPVASATQFNRETINGKKAIVSEIFINC